MNNFPLKGDLNAVRTWLNNEGYDDKCLTENWDAEALLGADKEIISKNFQLPEEEGRLDTLWSLLATARRREALAAVAAQSEPLTQGSAIGKQATTIDKDLLQRIQQSVLCVSLEEDVLATAIVWDYTQTYVLILTNYHTWERDEFLYCFPPLTQKKESMKRKRNVRLKLRHKDGFHHIFDVTDKLFYKWNIESDFAVLKLPKNGFTMARIPISFDIARTLNIYACGYFDHLNSNSLNVTQGVVSGYIPRGFTMNFSSANGVSGAAVVADFYGRAIGYMGGSYDNPVSEAKNSQPQGYAFRFDEVVLATNRKTCPTSFPDGKGRING